MSDLDKAAENLAQRYREWKEAERAKNLARDEFFRAASEKLAQEPVQPVVERVDADGEEEALRIAQRRFVRHRVVGVADVGSGEWEITLEPDVDLQPYQHVNHDTETVCSRVISEGSPILDDEGMQEERPEIWEAITRTVTRRELKPMEELSPEQQAALEPYITMPKPQVRLGPVRPAKAEELDG